MLSILLKSVLAGLGTLAGKLITGPFIYLVIKKCVLFVLQKFSLSTKNTFDDELYEDVKKALQ